MTAMSGARFCVHCDLPIESNAVQIEPIEAGAGVHPDEYRHPDCGPVTAQHIRRAPTEPRS